MSRRLWGEWAVMDFDEDTEIMSRFQNRFVDIGDRRQGGAPEPYEQILGLA